MLTSTTFLFFMMLLLLAALLEPVTKKTPLPFSIVLVVLGFLGSEITTKLLHIDIGLRWDNFKSIVFNIILPILIFQTAMEINIKALWRNIVPIMILSLPLIVVSTLLIAFLLYVGIDHPSGFPWIAALIAGALLSVTDPSSVVTLLKQNKTPENLQMLLEGESLFNDATGIVLFSVLIAIATNPYATVDTGTLALHFSEEFFGGIILGMIAGGIAVFLIKLLNTQKGFILVSIISAYTSFTLTQNILHFSGIMAVLICGMIISYYCRAHLSETSFARQLWQFLSGVAESLIFLLAGVTITLMMFTDRWLAMLIGIGAVILTRMIVIYGSFPFISLLPFTENVPLKHQTVLVWGGVRGTVTLALALSLPLALDYWYTIQSIAYGVVIFTLFFQTITMPLILKKLTN